MSRPFLPRNSSTGAFVRINGKIRAREVRVIGVDGNQLGVLTLGDALTQARANGVDLVEIAPNATPPVCRLVDFGKFRYEQAKKERESKKHQHANKVKEIQLSPKIDPHDLGVKISHAVDFLCDDMKVKVALKFRGREMAHTEVGFQVIERAIKEIAPFGQPDFTPKLVGRAINVMISPLPRNKRAKNSRQTAEGQPTSTTGPVASTNLSPNSAESPKTSKPDNSIAPKQPPSAFGNSPFTKLDLSVRQDTPSKPQ